MAVTDLIYFDNNATTRPLPEVVDAMGDIQREAYANPSSVHRFGQAARHRVESARQEVAELIGASPKEIIFTSGGTESINLAVRGTLNHRPNRRHLLTTTVEHSAVHSLMEQLAVEGWWLDRVGVDRQGRLDVQQWADKLSDETALASIIHANNETGVLFDVAEIAGLTARRGVPLHVDAVQSAGKVPIDVSAWPVQLLSLSGHKFHGPKGCGALFVRRRTRMEPIIRGGAQERRLRGGTENVAGIVGMGVAARHAASRVQENQGHIGGLRDALEQGLTARVPFARVNGGEAPRIHNTSNISFENLEAEAILLLLSEAGICASSGAACSSGSLEPSHVLKAMDLPESLAHGAIRFSLSRFNTQEEVDQAVEVIPDLLSRLTSLSRS